MKGCLLFNIMRKLLRLVLLFSIWFVVTPVSATQEPSKPVVHAVLFYSPSCGHCYKVINEGLPPLFEKYGEQLYIVGVNVSEPGGQALFKIVLQYFNLETGGVPFLLVGDTYLVGEVDIPEKFPGLIDQYLAQDGLDWPSIPGLVEALTIAQSTQTSSPQTTTQAAPTMDSVTPTPTIFTPTPASFGLLLTDDITLTIRERLELDPPGNGLAVIVLAGMIITLFYGIIFFWGSFNTAKTHYWIWLIPVLCIAGLAVAGYLAYVETTRVEAFCGPVGDCNTVQQSVYARLFGVFPIGVIGVVGYTMILMVWIIRRIADKRLAAYASLAMLVMTSFGLLFSIYLTFLEPFVIGATCAWCLTSAIITTALFWLSLAPGKAAFIYLFNGE